MCFKSSFTSPAVAAISFCLIGGTVPAVAYADLGDKVAKLLPDHGAAFDKFGHSVAISGPTAIVGAYGDDENGTSSGSVYLFDVSDPNNPAQIARLLADDGAAGGIFGYSVGISGPPGKEVAIVGAYGDDDNGNLSGSAYLFDAASHRKVPVGP